MVGGGLLLIGSRIGAGGPVSRRAGYASTFHRGFRPVRRRALRVNFISSHDRPPGVSASESLLDPIERISLEGFSSLCA